MFDLTKVKEKLGLQMLDQDEFLYCITHMNGVNRKKYFVYSRALGVGFIGSGVPAIGYQIRYTFECFKIDTHHLRVKHTEILERENKDAEPRSRRLSQAGVDELIE